MYLIVLPVLIRIHWGMGRFCFIFLASFCLILNVFFDDCEQHDTTRAPLDQQLVYRSDDYQKSLNPLGLTAERKWKKQIKQVYLPWWRTETNVFNTKSKFRRPCPIRNWQTRKAKDQSSEHVSRLCLNRRDHSVCRTARLRLHGWRHREVL